MNTPIQPPEPPSDNSVASSPNSPPAGIVTDDPVRRKRAQVARWTLLANRIGYLVLALAMTLFVMAFVFGFTSTMATLIIISLVVSFTLLAPSIVLGYAVKAAEREDVERGI
jgi:hypothetical protein